MAEAFLQLSQDDQREVLEIVREKTQRPTLLLEKDVWVVWTLGALSSTSSSSGRAMMRFGKYTWLGWSSTRNAGTGPLRCDRKN